MRNLLISDVERSVKQRRGNGGKIEVPYIEKGRREILDNAINNLIQHIRHDPIDGELNYMITRIIDAAHGGGGYARFNRAMGVLDCVAREFYRRRVVPYENVKIEENGDVYN